MVPSRTLVAPGLRTRPAHAWRSFAIRALAVVAGDPALWLLGSAGFLLRGGIVIIMLPIIVLPTQVEVRLALGANLASTGLTADFWMMVAAGTVVSSLLALGALVALARIEHATFRRLMSDPELGALPAPHAGPPMDGPRGLSSRLFVVQALALLAVCVAALPLAAAIGQTTLAELLRPTSSAAIYDRVLGQVGVELFILGTSLIVIELMSAVASRRLLADAYGIIRDGRPSLLVALLSALTRPLRHPFRVLGSAVLAWLVTLAALLPALWAIDMGWQAVRGTFLAATSVADLMSSPEALLVAGMLAAAFVGALLLAGYAAAVRAALWSADALG